jgi:hypothetical protein
MGATGNYLAIKGYYGYERDYCRAGILTRIGKLKTALNFWQKKIQVNFK